jgi:hypothetical protein
MTLNKILQNNDDMGIPQIVFLYVDAPFLLSR